MRHLIRIGVVIALAAAVVGCLGGRAQAAAPVLVVTYSGQFPTVTLPRGTPVGTPSPPGTSIPAGNYTVEISVQTDPADFQVVGPGVNFLDNEPSTENFTITFAPNSTYSYEDVNDPAKTIGYFTTTSVIAQGPSSTNTKTSTTSEANSDLVGSKIGKTVKLPELDAVLTSSGTALFAGSERLKAGRYAVVVDDESAKAGLGLKHGTKTTALTSSAFKGARTVKVTLTAGKWQLAVNGKSAVTLTVT